MKKLYTLLSLLAMFSFASCEENDIIGEIDNGFEEVILGGKNIAGVWSVVKDKMDSDFIDYIVDELCVIDGEIIEAYKTTQTSGYGFKDNYLYECSLEDYEMGSSAMFYVVGNKAYVDGIYAGVLEIRDDNTLFLVKEEALTVLKRVKGFKMYELPSSGEIDERGLPIPLDNEIYYRTVDGKQLSFSLGLFTLRHTYDEGKNYGRIVFYNAVEYVHVFYGCTTLTEVNIPNSLSVIGTYAFNNCSSLTSIAIPESVTSIGEMAFLNCTSLTSVFCKAVTPPMGGECMFSYINWNDYYYNYEPIGCTIYVPTESVEAYKSAEYWSEYADSIVGYDF